MAHAADRLCPYQVGYDNPTIYLTQLYAVTPLEVVSPPAGWYQTFFLEKKWLSKPLFPQKDQKRTMLPQANLAFVSGSMPK